MNIKSVSIENIKRILAGFKTNLLLIMDKKIQDNKIDVSLLMDKKSFVSINDTSSVNKSETAKELEGINTAPIFSIYGVDPDGNKGFYSFPVSSSSGGNFTKTLLDVKANTRYSIALADERKYYDLICQVYKFIPGTEDSLQVVKAFDNTESYNFSYDNENVSFNGGMQINKVHPLDISTNIDGFFESEIINKTNYLILDSLI